MKNAFSLLAIALSASGVQASPIGNQKLDLRNLAPAVCSSLETIVPSLQSVKATSFCSSFLSLQKSTLTATTTVTARSSSVSRITITATPTTVVEKSTVTITVSGTSTSYVFLQSTAAPASNERLARRLPKPEGTAIAALETPGCMTGWKDAAISSACSCLDVPVATQTVSKTLTKTSIITVVSTKTVTPTVKSRSTTTITSTVVPTITTYPCNNLVNNQGPAYGDYSDANDLGLQNDIYSLSTPEGASAEACCNTCFFEIANCVQAFWYFYEGCVVSQATITSTGSGVGTSGSCPAGIFNGLTYGPDVNPAFRSTGNIAGPCGSHYSNF